MLKPMTESEINALSEIAKKMLCDLACRKRSAYCDKHTRDELGWWMCTRSVDHTGPHIAGFIEMNAVHLIWED